MFRNTRAQMAGFPQRKFCPAPLAGTNVTLLARIARELEAEETGSDGAIRYGFRDDPRIDWLAAFLQAEKPNKVLLICKSQRKVAAIETALQEKLNVKIGLFHEGLPLVRRDRNAAWFAEPDGAQILLCSEIGSEGRNFQFAHHLVLLDLPLNPGLLEQRIGRLDRIGQTHPIQIHVPFIEGSSEEFVVEWYHRGLDAIETPLLAGHDYQDAFKPRLLALALAYGQGDTAAGLRGRTAFIAETVKFRQELSSKLAKGRDRLLELNSFNRETAERVIARIREEDADPFLRNFLSELLDHFGVRLKEHEAGDIFLDPSHAYLEGFPSIPREGMLATFSRARAIVREDIRFISADHPLVRDAADLLIDSKSGTTAFSLIRSEAPNLLLEAIFVLETVAEAGWHVDQFLAPQPVRVLVDLRGNDLTAKRHALSVAADAVDGSLQRFLERPGFNAAVLKAMLEGATELAEVQTESIRQAAAAKAREILGADLQRLVDLRKINNHVRLEEIESARQRLGLIGEAIAQARLRLDSLRLVIEGPAVSTE
jgi:ATP-dependent helicase HepA